MDHTEEIPYMNINQVAQDTYVSKTVIINLSQKLGFSGFKELKFHISQSLRNKEKEIQQMIISPKVTMERSIKKTLSLVKEGDVLVAAKTIIKSRNIFIMARGTSKPVGYYLEHLLFSLGMHCFFINDYNLSESFTRLVDDDDVVILISLSGNTAKILDTARSVHMKKATIISLTSFQTNKLSDYSDIELFCYSQEFNTKTDDAISRIGFFILIDLLIQTIKNELD